MSAFPSCDRAGRKTRFLRQAPSRPDHLPARCAQCEEYNLHAGVVVGAHDRAALERLSRYLNRPAVAKGRLKMRADGLVELTLRRAYRDGTTSFLFSPVEFVERLAALVPPPHKNEVSYHGVLAARSRFRSRVVPSATPEPSRGVLRKQGPPRREPARYQRWADLLWRVFQREAFRCRCGRRMELHAVVLPPATLGVLDSLSGARDPPMAA